MSKRAAATGDKKESAQGPSVMNHVAERDPKNYTDAMRSSKREDWKKAMLEEIKALEDNGMWRLIKRSANSNALDTKWVYKTKTDAEGNIEDSKRD